MESGFLPPALAELAPGFLLAARVGGMVLVAPVYSARVVPSRVKAAVWILMTIAIYPMAIADPSATFGLVSLIREMFLGVIVGLGAAVFVGAAEAAGEWIAVQTGLSGATTLDPTSSRSTPTLGQFLNFTITLVLLTVGAHLVLLEAVAATTDVVPLGGAPSKDAGVAMAVLAGSTLFTMGLRLAAPVVAVVLVANAALGVLARTAPQVNLLLVAFPVQIGLGLLVLGFSLPTAATMFTSWTFEFEGLLGGVLGPFNR